MAKKRKTVKRKVKKVKLTPDVAVSIAVPKGVVPSVITDPNSGAVHVIPIPEKATKNPGWFERLLFG